jgi:hypothetical protein
MKNLLWIVLLILNTNLVSCQKIETKNEKDSLKKVSDTLLKNNEKEKIFKQKKIICLGEKNSCTSCSNTEEDISILFNKNSFSFGINSKKYFYSLEGFLSEFGHQVYLFNNADENIIVIEEFYEEVDLHRFFYTKNNEIYFMGEKTYGNEDRINYINFKKRDNIITAKFSNTTTNKSNNLQFNLAVKKKLNYSLIDKTYPSDLVAMYGVICQNELTELDINKSEGFLSLYSPNAIYIKLKVEKSSNENEYILKFASTSSQRDYYPEMLKVKDEEISKDKIIGRLIVKKDNKAQLKWIGLFNTKKNKLEFVGDEFLFIRENGGKNPVTLEKCE